MKVRFVFLFVILSYLPGCSLLVDFDRSKIIAADAGDDGDDDEDAE